jgi:hypothetical protein
MVGSQDRGERELAEAMRQGMRRRGEQAFGEYFGGSGRSCALGAAYDGMYLLPADPGKGRPQQLDRLFECLEGTVRRCPHAGCRKKLALGVIIVHLNDDHRWTREQIVEWLAGPSADATH